MITSCNPSIFDGQNARTFLEQLRKPAGGGITDHLGDLTHGEIGVNQQVLRLAHAPPLDIFRDSASGVPLKAGFELACAHAGDACKAFQRDVIGVMICNVAYYITKPRNILF